MSGNLSPESFPGMTVIDIAALLGIQLAPSSLQPGTLPKPL